MIITEDFKQLGFISYSDTVEANRFEVYSLTSKTQNVELIITSTYELGHTAKFISQLIELGFDGRFTTLTLTTPLEFFNTVNLVKNNL